MTAANRSRTCTLTTLSKPSSSPPTTPDVPFGVYNVATGDYITVREIVELAIDVVGLDLGSVDVRYGTEDRGWKGDVPIVRLSTERLKSLGWRCRRDTRLALRDSLLSMLADAQAGRLT